MQDRRQYRRGRTYLGGRLAFNNQYCAVDCLVRNMSRNGAKLVFEGSVLLPGEFELTLPQKGESRRARIVWRQQDEAGIVFFQPDAKGVVSIEMARQIKRLETDRAALRARLAELTGSA
ncbi:MAG: PilZ domain-containing protein [Methylobacteriaceae bacterium]|nr:PilZ domain-containing protein [Methylobacteriaceae bacterium]